MKFVSLPTITASTRLKSASGYFFFVVMAIAAQTSVAAERVALSTPRAAPAIEAEAWALMEQSSGWVVTSESADITFPPASITKLMSNYVIFKALDAKQIALSDEVNISEKAWRSEGSRMFAEVNSKVSLEHLLKSTIIQSGNDAAIALAEHLSGSEVRFADLMNKAAINLGMTQSRFGNATGLPAADHFMSAMDILTLSAAIIEEFPDFYPWYAIKEYEHNGIKQYNRNKLLWTDPTIDGLKTGYTSAAGYCLVATAVRGDTRWLAVVLGAEGERVREREVMKLIDFGYANFDVFETLDQQGGVTGVPVIDGESKQVRLKPAAPVHVVVPRGRRDDLETKFQIAPEFTAPISYGDPMGIATLYLDGQPLTDVSLIAMSDIPRAGFLQRTLDSITRLWE